MTEPTREAPQTDIKLGISIRIADTEKWVDYIHPSSDVEKIWAIYQILGGNTAIAERKVYRYIYTVERVEVQMTGPLKEKL